MVRSVLQIFIAFYLLSCLHQSRSRIIDSNEGILFGHWYRIETRAPTTDSDGSSRGGGILYDAHLFLNEDSTFSLDSDYLSDNGYIKTSGDTISFFCDRDNGYTHLKMIYLFDIDKYYMAIQAFKGNEKNIPMFYLGNWIKLNRWGRGIKIDGVE